MKLNYELTDQQEATRRGSTPGQIKVALAAKAIIGHIRANPGCTKQEIFDALGDAYVSGGFTLLEKHKQAYHQGCKPARWFPTPHIK